jgi:mRNA-degrading endonuclease RelE of RelBE toxin-antitoxin system
VDSGEHRIYYEMDDRQRVVTARLVGPRNDDAIYKELGRKLGK